MLLVATTAGAGYVLPIRSTNVYTFPICPKYVHHRIGKGAPVPFGVALAGISRGSRA